MMVLGVVKEVGGKKKGNEREVDVRRSYDWSMVMDWKYRSVGKKLVFLLVF